MTSEPPLNDPDTGPIRKLGSGERKRAALILAVLAVAAVVLVGVLYAIGSSNGGNSATTTTRSSPTGPAVLVTGVGSRSARSSTGQSTKPKPTTPAPSTSARTGPVSCPTSAPCALPDDIGNVLKSLNDYRSANGAPAVTGSVTTRAQTCAVNSGDTSRCPSGYYWEPVGRSGDQVITKIEATGGKGKAWLLDKTMSKVEIGWAYIPSSHSYECALVAQH